MVPQMLGPKNSRGVKAEDFGGNLLLEYEYFQVSHGYTLED